MGKCCDYSTPFGSRDTTVIQRDKGKPSWVRKGPCGWDLSDHAQLELLGLVALDGPTCRSALAIAVDAIVDESGTTMAKVLDEYKNTVMTWLPLHLPRESQEWSSAADRLCLFETMDPVFFLAILLILTRPCMHPEHVRAKVLYTTVRSLSSSASYHQLPNLELVKIQALIALYECGHGMARQAYMTLGSAVAVATLIVSDEVTPDQVERSFHWKLALMLVDVYVRRSAWLP